MNTTDQSASIDKDQRYKTLRERWDKEDTLLISRTAFFLRQILF